MAEWLKAHDSKSCRRQRLGGSNPLASARNKKYDQRSSFLCLRRRLREDEGQVRPMPGRVCSTTAHCLYPLASARSSFA